MDAIMNIDIEKKLAEIEKNLALKDAIARTLEASKVNKKITMEQITEIESISPGILTDTIQDLRDSKVTMEELTLLHKGLIASGLLAIIALIMKLFGGGGGGSGGGGGGGGSSIVAKVQEGGKIAKQNDIEAEKLDDELEECDWDAAVDKIEAWIVDMMSDDDDEKPVQQQGTPHVATPTETLITEIYDEIVEAENGETVGNSDEVPYVKKAEKIKATDGISDRIQVAARNRCLRLAPYEILWSEKDHTLNYLTNALLDQFQDASYYNTTQVRKGGGPGMEFINHLSDYLFSMNDLFQYLDDNKNDMQKLFNEKYGSTLEQHPLLKLPPSYVNYLINHADHNATYKSEITNYSEIWHGSVKLMEYLRTQMAIPISQETLNTLNDINSFSRFSTVINKINGGLSGYVLALDAMKYDLVNPEFTDAIKNVHRIYNEYSNHRWFPHYLRETYKEFKEVDKFTKNMLSIMVMVLGMYTKIDRSMKKYSDVLGKQRKLVERIAKYNSI